MTTENFIVLLCTFPAIRYADLPYGNDRFLFNGPQAARGRWAFRYEGGGRSLGYGNHMFRLDKTITLQLLLFHRIEIWPPWQIVISGQNHLWRSFSVLTVSGSWRRGSFIPSRCEDFLTRQFPPDPNRDPYGKFQRKGPESFGEVQRLPESTFPMVCAAWR